MDPAIRCACDSLSSTYGTRKVLRGCSFMVYDREMVGLVGENGSGKSTLVRSLLGFSRPSGGKVWVTPSVGYCPQENFLNRRITVKEHFAFMMEIYARSHVLNQRFMQMLLEKLKLVPYMQTRIGHLSSGTYQKVKFVTAVAHRPSMIFLDEPCDGFDWAMYLAFWEIMTLIKAEGSAVLMVSHLLYDRERFDRIFELREGICEQVQ
jgi:ABC-2 type transport system ATP-binding protein